MPTNLHDSSGISQRTNVYAASQMLAHALPHLVLEKFGKAVRMPKSKSDTIKWRRPNTFSAQTTPLAEGITPDPVAFGYTDVSATLQQYGHVSDVTDRIEDHHEDPVLQNMTEMVGENLGRTIEQLNYSVVKGGTSVFYGNGSARSDVNTPVTIHRVRAAIRYLMANKAMKMTSVLDGSPNFNTRPVQAGYVCVAHTDLDADIRALPGFVPVAEYGSRQPLHDLECGTVEQVRFILSADLDAWADAGGDKGSTVSTSGTKSDVYPMIFFGKDAWAHVALRGYGAVDPTVIPPSQKTKDDPLGQRGYVGWKTYHAAAILNDSWMTRLEVAASDLA